MQHDEMIWQVISHQFCSFKTTIGKNKSDQQQLFCRHPYSVTGLCNRMSCPLANSKYATLREKEGKIVLYIKTPERAHSPKNLWEPILLSRNYNKALQQLDEHLQYFPKVLLHRNKQRLTKIHQYLLRMRKIKLKQLSGHKAKMVGIHRKIEQQEERREQKALTAAKLTKSIEQELLQRLAKGTYGDLYNVPESEPYQKVLQQEEESEEEEEEGLVEYVEDLEEEEDEHFEDLEYMGDGQWGSIGEQDEDDSEEEEDSEEDEDSDDDQSSSSSSNDENEDDKHDKKRKAHGRPRRGTRVEIEYEQEEEEETSIMQQEQDAVAGMAW